LTALLGIVLAVGIGACQTQPDPHEGGAPDDGLETSVTQDSPQDATGRAATPEGDVTGGATPRPASVPSRLLESPAVRAAISAEAASLGVDEERVEVVDVREVTWPDAGLGCAPPDQMVAQVLTPGFKVTLEVDGQRAVYRTDRPEGNRDPYLVRCDADQTGSAISDPFGSKVYGRIVADLVERVGAEEEPAHLDSRAVPIAELSCDGVQVGDDSGGEQPEGDGAGEPGLEFGAIQPLIMEYRLRAAGAIHVYRAFMDDFVYCGNQRVDEAGNPID